MAFLEIENLHKSFGANTALHHFDMKIERGEFITFLGPSGCGKTTVLRMIAGFESPTRGVIRLDGRDVTHLRTRQRKVGMVFQSYALFPNMTVADNIGFGLRVTRRPQDEIRKRVDEMLELIKLPNIAERYPWQLSGGQQQRVALLGRWPASRRYCCSTNRSRRSTRKSASPCGRTFARCSASSASRRSS